MENLSPKEFIKEFKSKYGGMALKDISVLLTEVVRDGKTSNDEEDEIINKFISKYGEMAFNDMINFFGEMVSNDKMAFSDVIDFLDEMALNGQMALDDEQEEIIIKCSLENMAKAFFKDYEIIWHDPNVNSEENRLHMTQLEKLCRVKTFTEWKEAEDYIKSAKTVCNVITSGTNGELLVKEIFSSANVPNILTFCRDKDHHSTWAKNYQKVLCTKTKIEDVIEQIKKNLLAWHKQTASLKFDLPAFAPIFDDYDKSSMNHLHHYLKVIPRFKNRAQAKTDFIKLSRGVYSDKKNDKLIANFEQTYNEYNKRTLLKWYTQQSFLYKMINNCLRIATSDSIQWSRFLLKDIETAIKDQYQAKSKEFSGLLYRAAYLSEKEWSSLKKNVNREIEMHGFLSVSKEKCAAFKFMGVDPAQKVFITIIVPKGPVKDEQGFAEVEKFSKFPKEKEVLFNVRSRFTVLETEDEYSKDLPSRHLILLYGAQSLRRYMAEKIHVYRVTIEDGGRILCSRCQVPTDQMTEKIFFISLVNVENPISFCQKCLDDAHAPFLCVPYTGKTSVINIKGCLLINPNQPQTSLYGYRCSQCGSKKQKAYFGCTDCSDSKKRWCQSCFGKKPDCVEAGHSVILETYPFSFWSEKMSEKELHHLNFHNNLVKESSHQSQQAEMYRETHEFEKAIKQVHLFIEQNEAQVKGSLLADSYRFIGLINKEQGKYDKALEYLFESLDIYKSVHRENHPEIGTSLMNISSVYSLQGDYDKAYAYIFKSLEIQKKGNEKNDPSVGSAYKNKGGHDQLLGDLFKSLEFCKSVYGENHPELNSWYNDIGFLYSEEGKYDQAFSYLFKSLEICKSVHGENHPFVARSYNKIGLIYQDQGEYDQALVYFFKSLEICISVYGENHPDIATSFRNIGLIFEEQREHKQALEYLLKSLDINKSISGEKHYSVATSYRKIGSLYKRQGEYDQSLEYLFKSLDIYQSVDRGNHPDIAVSYCIIAAIYDCQREYKKALKYHLEALDILKPAFGETHEIVAVSYHYIAMVYHKQGESQESALEYLLKSLDIQESACDKNHLSLALSYSSLGTILTEKGDLQKALKYSLKSLEILKSFEKENQPEIVSSYNRIGQVYYHLKEFEKALEYYFNTLKTGLFTRTQSVKHFRNLKSVSKLPQTKRIRGLALSLPDLFS